MSGIPDRVSVLLMGPKSVVESLTTEVVRAYVDLGALEPGVGRKAPVRVRLAPKYRKVVVAESAIDQVTATVEETVSSSFPVEVNIVSPEPLGRVMSTPEVLPSSVLVTGQSSNVTSIKRLVANVDVGGATQVLDSYFPVVAIDRTGKKIADLLIEPRQVRVRIRMLETPVARTLLISPTIVGLPNPPLRVRDIEVIPPTVTVSGNIDRLAGVGSLTTDAINIAGATASVSKSVRIHVPPGVTLTGPHSVQVSIKIE